MATVEHTTTLRTIISHLGIIDCRHGGGANVRVPDSNEIGLRRAIFGRVAGWPGLVSSRMSASRRHMRTRTEVTSSFFFPPVSLRRICYDVYQLVGPHKRLSVRRRVISEEPKVERYLCYA